MLTYECRPCSAIVDHEVVRGNHDILYLVLQLLNLIHSR